MAAFVLDHLSDPHLAPLPRPRLRELAGKRALGYLNWTRNRQAIQRRDVLDTLIADLSAGHSDHIAVTGDLINIGMEAEFAPARAWLESVGSPDRVTLVPGNHDSYVRATQHRAIDAWADFMHGDGARQGQLATFPFVRRRGPVTLIGVSTSVPTAPLMATGWLGRAQLDRLDHILAQLAGEPTFRVLLLHHPLRSAVQYKRLTDAEQLLAVLARRNVDLVLHGHDHVHSTMWIDGPNGQIPAVGVPSASALAHGHYPAAAYNRFLIERVGAEWRCEQIVRGLTSDGRIEELRRAQLR